MKNIIRALSYLRGYRGKVALNILLSIVSAFLEVVSLLSIIPFLQLILDDKKVEILEKPASFSLFPITNSIESAKENLGYLVNHIIANNDKITVLKWICISTFALFLIKNLIVYWQKYISQRIKYSVSRDYREVIYKKILKLPMSFLNDKRRGDILSRFSTDLHQLESSVLSAFDLIFKEPVMVLFYLLCLIAISFKLTIFIFLMIPVLGIIIGRISRSLKKSSTKAQEKSAELFSLVDETMLGSKVMKAFNAEGFFYSTFRLLNKSYFNLEKRISKRKVAASPVSETLGIFVVMIVLWYGGNLVISGNSTSLDGKLLIAYLIVFASFIRPLKNFSKLQADLQRGMASADRIDEFLATENPIQDKENAVLKDSFDEKITFDSIDFVYPNAEQKVLDNVSITVPKGKTIALVGQSGAGKSTFAELLPRFYDVVNGSIRIDGVDIREIKLESLRKLIAYVSQEAILFNDSIENNIRFGMQNVTDDDIVRAAKIANAHDFILQQEQGYQTNVGERGGKLSGGQKQRITIARAVLKNAPILILDEATSALDTESERLVQDAIDKLLENRTAIVIAHRLSTIKHADQIYVFQDGKIIEQGTHEELVNQSGHYKKLTEMQAV